MSFEDQVSEIQNYFLDANASLEMEGGCRFLRLPSFFSDPGDKQAKLTCLFACDNHLGYETRLWFPKLIQTSEKRNWNHKNIYILNGTWFAFSYKTKGETLLDKLLSHLRGAK